ncbi:MAG: roadblock/LC7 domain-containing protein [Methanobacterium sp.]|uniref:roadblock/LC7 domain-containing protein n=1 Tax=Methanobacterium sp. TaxID=2164 RepID=UPI003C734B8E
MEDNNLKVELERIVNDLGKVDGVEGGLIVDCNGDILSQRILQDIDISLFGPMANVITSSSKRLISSSNQGKIQRVLVESENGKALFLDLGKVHFIVLMKNHANVGLIMVSSKRAAEKIIELTKDLEIVLETDEIPVKPKKIISKTLKEEPLEIAKDVFEPEKIKVEADKVEITEDPIPDSNTELIITEPSIPEPEELEAKVESLEVVEQEPIETGGISDEPIKEKLEVPVKAEKSIPVIKPPIAFPEIKKVVEIPESIEERSDLILDIYESIFRAMSIGASKIMGVAPARGLTQKFLPYEECKILLDGVKVKSNSTIDFKRIRENVVSIPLEERESIFTKDFTKIIEVITENYGKVMGYGAFRGMVRPEFRIITDSYGPVMHELGITEKIHPEMADLLK